MSNVQLLEETTIHFAEHEVMLSFTNDEDATHFFDWWALSGEGEFNEYLKRQEETK